MPGRAALEDRWKKKFGRGVVFDLWICLQIVLRSSLAHCSVSAVHLSVCTNASPQPRHSEWSKAVKFKGIMQCSFSFCLFTFLPIMIERVY